MITRPHVSIYFSFFLFFLCIYVFLFVIKKGRVVQGRGLFSSFLIRMKKQFFSDSISVVRREEKEEEISICKWEPEASIAKTKLSCGREHMFRRKALYFLSLFWWRALMVCLFYKCGSIESVRMYVSTGRFFAWVIFLKFVYIFLFSV